MSEESHVRPSKSALDELEGLQKALAGGQVAYPSDLDGVRKKLEKAVETDRTPDHRDISDISTTDECTKCEWSPAAVILVDGEWQCYNCGEGQ